MDEDSSGRSRAAPMEIDSKDDTSAWINTSTTITKNASTESLLKQSHSTLGFSTPISRKHGIVDFGLTAIHPEPSKEDMALNSPFKLAQQIFAKKTDSKEDSARETPSHNSPVKSVGSAGSMRRRAMILGKPMFSRRHYKEERKQHEVSPKPGPVYWPFVLMGYLQLSFNLFVIGALVYLAITFYQTIKKDVDLKVAERITAILSEIENCRKQYVANRCDQRVPAIEAACSAWEACMQRNPTLVSRARLSAETFAEIIEGFIEPISYKTMVFVMMAGFGSVFLSNLAFSLARNRVKPPNIDTNQHSLLTFK